MCGLFGIVQHGTSAPPSRELLNESARRLRHRGPDGVGVHAAPGIGLVHTRLSLVDLNERSNQPFWDANHRYCLVYNGELYDYGALQAELEQRGVVFRTTSDTEVLLEALIHLGVEAALPRLEGMFAFAFYDSQSRTLVLSRDRFGMKPLLIHDGASVFLFGSEVTAMRPWLALKPDPSTVNAFLRGSNGPMSGRSFYDQVSIVPPGAVVRVSAGGRVEVTQCLSVSDLEDPDLRDRLAGRSDDALTDEVEQHLLASVKSQLQADVPVGAFCSGGVDSSLLMSMAARHHSDLRVFHADIVGPLSERSAAETLARHLKLDMKTVSVRDADFVDHMPDIVKHFGFPYAVLPQSVPIFLVSHLVRENGIKAVLTGEGSDECYLGYPWLVPDLRAALGRVPGRLLHKLRIRREVRPSPRSPDDAVLQELTVGLGGNGASHETPFYHAALQRAANTIPSLATDPELLYILRTLLHRNDTMGMAASIEARFPFLDSRLVRLSINLPYRSKIRFSPKVLDAEHLLYRDKWVIRRIADRYVPRALSQRRKRGLPVNAYQRLHIDDELFGQSFVADYLGVATTRLQALLRSATYDLKYRLLHLEAWGHVCVRELPEEALRVRLARLVRVTPG